MPISPLLRSPRAAWFLRRWPVMVTASALVLTDLSAQRARPQVSLLGAGVSAELAEVRRKQLAQVRYELALTVGTGDQAEGRVTATFLRRGTGDVVLDFRGQALSEVVVNGTPWPAAAAHWNGQHLAIPARLVTSGVNRVAMRFRVPIAPAGAAIIRYRDATDSSTYLYTLLVPNDAPLLFPCFDQPDLKARVRLTLVTPSGWNALGNGALVDTNGSGNLVTHRFAETAPLSTYLIAFAAGPWLQQTRLETIVPGRAAAPLSLWMRRSRAAEVDADTLLAMNATALRWLGEYFGVPYPFGSYAALLAPAFPFGGMEHPGAVFYNEDSFVYRERPTATQLLGRQATTFHEVAHQWFGDYVTMRWFDDLWLKEGFATFMAAVMQDALAPESHAWKTFYLRNKPAAYGTDATAGTTPVWQRLANLDQAKSNYGPIVYNKAPSLLRQLQYLVGPDAFQRGVRDFLQRHPYGNATWQELLGSIGRASGRDLTAWGRQWMLRPGMPVINQELSVRNGRIVRLRLIQRPAQPALSGRGSWPLKVQVGVHFANRAPVRIPIELTGDTTVVASAVGLPAPTFVYANEGDYGYALVLPDSQSVAWLEQQVETIPDELLRAMLFGSLWDLVREAQLDPQRYAAMVMRALPRERDEQLVGTLAGRLATILTRYRSDENGANGDSTRTSGLLARVEPMLLAGARDTTRSYGIRKTHLDRYIGLARTPAALAQLRQWLSADSAAGLAVRAPTRWAIVTRLVAQGADDHASLIAQALARDATSEGRRQAFAADAARPDSAHKAALFHRWFADRSLNEEWVSASLSAFHDGDQQALTRVFLRPALDTLPWIQRNRRIFFLGSWLGATLGGQRGPEALAAVDAWLREHPALPRDLREKVLQSRDELVRTVRIRARFGGR